MMVTSWGLPPDPVKQIILIILGALWVYQALGDMLSIIVSNSHFGKRSAARVMTIVSFHFLPNDRFTGFGRPDFDIVSKIIDLDVQTLDWELQIKDLNVRIYDFWKTLKNLKTNPWFLKWSQKYASPNPGFLHTNERLGQNHCFWNSIFTDTYEQFRNYQNH